MKTNKNIESIKRETNESIVNSIETLRQRWNEKDDCFLNIIEDDGVAQNQKLEVIATDFINDVYDIINYWQRSDKNMINNTMYKNLLSSIINGVFIELEATYSGLEKTTEKPQFENLFLKPIRDLVKNSKEKEEKDVAIKMEEIFTFAKKEISENKATSDNEIKSLLKELKTVKENWEEKIKNLRKKWIESNDYFANIIKQKNTQKDKQTAILEDLASDIINFTALSEKNRIKIDEIEEKIINSPKEKYNPQNKIRIKEIIKEKISTESIKKEIIKRIKEEINKEYNLPERNKQLLINDIIRRNTMKVRNNRKIVSEVIIPVFKKILNEFVSSSYQKKQWQQIQQINLSTIKELEHLLSKNSTSTYDVLVNLRELEEIFTSIQKNQWNTNENKITLIIEQAVESIKERWNHGEKCFEEFLKKIESKSNEKEKIAILKKELMLDLLGVETSVENEINKIKLNIRENFEKNINQYYGISEAINEYIDHVNKTIKKMLLDFDKIKKAKIEKSFKDVSNIIYSRLKVKKLIDYAKSFSKVYRKIHNEESLIAEEKNIKAIEDLTQKYYSFATSNIFIKKKESFKQMIKKMTIYPNKQEVRDLINDFFNEQQFNNALLKTFYGDTEYIAKHNFEKVRSFLEKACNDLFHERKKSAKDKKNKYQIINELIEYCFKNIEKEYTKQVVGIEPAMNFIKPEQFKMSIPIFVTISDIFTSDIKPINISEDDAKRKMKIEIPQQHDKKRTKSFDCGNNRKENLKKKKAENNFTLKLKNIKNKSNETLLSFLAKTQSDKSNLEKM